MNKKNIIKICVIILAIAVVAGIFTFYAQKTDSNIDYYTCPMHHQIHADEPGNCPICGMKLVPVAKQKNQSDLMSRQNQISIDQTKQKTIGVTTATVTTKPVKKTLKAFGQVAFDPELAAAQKEYVEILKLSPSLEGAAQTRLKLMGMSENEIESLKKKSKVGSDLYLPNDKTKTWIYAMVYENDRDLIFTGMPAVIKTSSADDKKIDGVVRGISPIIDEMSRATKVRIEVMGSDVALKPNRYVDVYFKLDLGEKLVMPKSALIDTGERKIAYVVHADTDFEPREIETGIETENDVIIISGLNTGETVVTNATFLIDSETQLKRGQNSGSQASDVDQMPEHHH